GPVFTELSLKRFGNAESFGFAPYPLWFMFSGASANETGFAVGFVGVEAKTEADFDRHTGSILEFDWNGNPLRRFILPAEATAFDIDYSNNAIYTIENRPDPTLVKYSITND
ncbi:MAG: TolB-like 6-bladed beta-propeller domain-containing protein, partial [Paramuribaculum sp.]|nr:TolB-like 6-bladed beta-propeller domain-containing protein [Paramuribaculum sp.]